MRSNCRAAKSKAKACRINPTAITLNLTEMTRVWPPACLILRLQCKQWVSDNPAAAHLEREQEKFREPAWQQVGSRTK